MKSKILLHGVFLSILVVARVISSLTADISYLALVVYALLGPAYAVRALGLSWFFTMLSPGIGPEEVILSSVGRYLILVAAAISVFLRNGFVKSRSFEISRPVIFSFVVGCFFLAHTILFSPLLDVSLLKSLTWMIVVVTLLSAWCGMSFDQRMVLERQVFYFLILLMLASFPLLGMSVGYFRNQTGFQGVLNHPQAFGLTMALLATWLAGQIFEKTKPPLHLLMFLFLTLILIVLSGARTAGLAFVLGFGIALFAGRIMAKKQLGEYLPGLSTARVRWSLAMTAVGLILTTPFWGEYISNYVTKETDNVTVAGAYEESRGFLIDHMLGNIQDHPLRGIGFGLASDTSTMVVDRDSVLGLPTGASIEKGVAYLAVWEEVGLFGFLMVLVWLWMMVGRAARYGGMTALAVCLTVLFMNLGESTFFSPGGMGLLSLILIAWATSGAPKQSGGWGRG